MTTNGVVPLLPLTRAHQHQLTQVITQLRGQTILSAADLTLLEHVVTLLPQLRAGVHGAERQYLDELDATHPLIVASLQQIQHAIGRVDVFLQDDQGEPITPETFLLDKAALLELAHAATHVAEAANELALRVTARANLLP